MAQGQIIALGSINADFQVRVAQRPGDAGMLIGQDFRALSGGKAANVAYLARRLGVPATLIGRVGDDALADQALGPLREIGVELRHTRAVVGRPTGVSMIAVPPDGEKTIILATNANDAWTTADADETAAAIAVAPPGSVLVVDLEIAPAVARRAMETARQRGMPIVLDPSPPDRMTDDLYPLADYLTPDASEAGRLTGIAADSVAGAIGAGKVLARRSGGNALVKLGGGGCAVVMATEARHIPDLPVTVVDATGAGDAFTGALAVALLEGRPLLDAARFATIASHLVVGRYGSQPAYPTRGEIEGLFADWPTAR